MHPNSFDLAIAAVAAAVAAVLLVLWIRTRRRAHNAERRLTRAEARADVLLIAAEEFHEQLTERERAVAAARTEAKRRHLHLVRAS